MTEQRLSSSDIARFLDACSDELCDLVLDVREFVLESVPEVTEAIKFNVLCYYKLNRPYGVIGGNVCMATRAMR